MHQDQNSARIGAQRQLLQMALNGKFQPDGSDVSRSTLGIRTQSPSLHADDVRGPQNYPDVDHLGSQVFGNPGAHQVRRAHEDALAAQIEDRKHLPDSSRWNVIGANSGITGASLPQSSMVASWATSAGSPLEGPAAEAVAASGLLNQQGTIEEHVRDTEVDAPLAALHMHNSRQQETLSASWNGQGQQPTADAALPFFPIRPVRTPSSHLASMSGVQRNSSFSGGHPGSARAAIGMEHSFAAEQLGYNASNSAPITPRSPSFNGYSEEDAAMALGLSGVGMSRHGPSKLRMSSSDNPTVSQPGLHLPGMSALDVFSNNYPNAVPDQGAMAAGIHAALQQQQQHMAQQAGLSMGPGSLPGSQPGSSNGMAAMGQALIGGMGVDLGMQQAPGFTGMMPGMAEAAGGMETPEYQALMYWAKLGMMAHMQNGNGMSLPNTPTAMTNSPMATAAATAASAMNNPMLLPVLNQQQLAAFTAAQQQWQSGGMPAATIANIAAVAAAAAATAASNSEADTGYGAGRNGARARVPQCDRLDRRLRCDRGSRSSGGRLDECGSPSAVRDDPLLEEFKANRLRRLEMRDVLGHMLAFSFDQNGSRFIQQKLDTLTPEELEAAFAEIASKGVTLMNDVFGNYVIQKFLELDVDTHRQELAQQMKGQVLQLSLQLYSCRVIQKALEVLPLDQKIAMVHELDGNLMRCVKDQNGNHVIQKVIECVPTEHITSLLDTFSGNLVNLSTHTFGCRVMQRILEHCTDQERYDSFMTETLKETVKLAQDQYGNYVIQHIVEQGRPHERDQVFRHLFPHIVVLSQNKFASNVVEKMLLHCEPEQRASIVEEFLRQPAVGENGINREQSPLEQMMQDQYGNYVVQKTLEVCDEGQRERLLSSVRCYYETLKSSTFGKHIVNRLEKLLSAGMRIAVNSLPAAAPCADGTSAPTQPPLQAAVQEANNAPEECPSSGQALDSPEVCAAESTNQGSCTAAEQA